MVVGTSDVTITVVHLLDNLDVVVMVDVVVVTSSWVVRVSLKTTTGVVGEGNVVAVVVELDTTVVRGCAEASIKALQTIAPRINDNTPISKMITKAKVISNNMCLRLFGGGLFGGILVASSVKRCKDVGL